MSKQPLIVHLIYRLDVGGLENGLVNVINRLAGGRFRHAIVCLKGSSVFRDRLSDRGVQIVDLQEERRWQASLWKTLRKLKPLVFHSRNLPTLEGQIVAAAAGVPARIHAEHGRDVYDLKGDVRRYRWLRRAVDPLIHRHVAVSADLRRWLVEDVGIRARKIRLIRNGVDIQRFAPGRADRESWPEGFRDPRLIVIGTVGRIAEVKDQPALVRAFCRIVEGTPGLRIRARLVLVGDGPLRAECAQLVDRAGVADLVWMPGSRNDVAALMRGVDVFVLPSKAEGMSNTVLEAMATGLPVVATAVGGSPELVQNGVTGVLVPAGDENALAAAVQAYILSPDDRARHGHNARLRAEREFSIETMVAGYQSLYDEVA